MKFEHLGNGPWCEDGTCGVCRKADADPRYHELLAGGPEPTEPSLLQKAASLASAVVRHAADGFQNVPAEEYEARLATCRKCEHYLTDYHPEERCGKCGCGLSGVVLAKAKWRSEKCPVGKW